MLPLDTFDLSGEEVRARFEWAVRNGNPYWLWPQTSAVNWRNALREIEQITRQILLHGRASDGLEAACEDLGVAAFTSGMGPLLGHWAAGGLLQAPTETLALLELQHRHNAERMEAMAKRAIEAVESLGAHGVSPLVIKGMQTAFAHFPAPATRPLSDIDIMVHPADKDRAGAALRELGYLPGKTGYLPPPAQQTWQMPSATYPPRSLMLTHWDNPWSIDLQTSLSRRYSVGAQIIDLDGLLCADLLEPWVLSPAARVLSLEPAVLHLACHASCGLENMMLMRLVELVFAIRGGIANDSFSWDRFSALAASSATLSSAYPALYLTELQCPGTVPQVVLEEGARRAPAAVRRVVQRLHPAGAQRVLRCSLEERFMWTRSPAGLLRQVLVDVFPASVPRSDLLAIYKMRLWRVLRGSFTRTAPEAF